MFTFLHAADLHLDSPLRGLSRYDGAPVDQLRGAVRQAMEKLVDLALEEQVAFVLLAGDLYDGDWKDYNTALFLITQLARLGAASIPVLIISGNHDAESVMTRTLRMPDNVHIFGTREPETHHITELRVAIHGQGYATGAVTDNLAQAYPAASPGMFNIGMLHTSLNGRKGHAPYAPCSVTDLKAKGYDYWALGHVHTREIVSESPWIVFPGNIQGRHARETGPKGCTLVTVTDGMVSDVVHHALDVVRWMVCDVDITGTEHPPELLEHIRGELRTAYEACAGRLLAIRLRLIGATGAHQDLTRDAEHWRQEVRAAALDIGAGGIWIEKVLVKTQPERSKHAQTASEDALGGLMQSLSAVELDDQILEELGGLFDDIKAKLPAPLTQGPEGVDLSSAEFLREAVADAKALLEASLSGGEASG